MPLTDSLDRELIENFVGKKPLGQEPLSPALQKVSGALLNLETHTESDRCRSLEDALTVIVTGKANSDETDEKILVDIFAAIDESLKGYRQDLEPSQQNELETLLCERILKIPAIPKDEVSYKAQALYILEGISEIFEEDLRLKIKKRMLVKTPGALSAMEYLHSEDRLMLWTKDFIRWVLWSATALTSWNGIGELLVLMARYGFLPENAALVNSIQYGIGIPVSLAVSEVVRLGKQNIEFTGSTRGLRFLESVKVLFRERTKFAILLLLVLPPDVLTNVTGGIEIFFAEQDSSDQIDKAKKIIEENKEAARAELEKAKLKGANSNASVMAARASTDEALGTYGTPQGLGPRFHALTATYFSGEAFDLMNGPNDPRCAMGEDQVAHEIYKGWTIDMPEIGSLCAYGTLDSGTKGWIVGERAGSSTTINEVLASAASSEGGLYALAYNKYLAFHSQHPASYPDKVKVLWQKYTGGVEEKMTARFAEIDHITATWKPEKSILANKEASRELIDPYFAEFKREEKTLRAELETEVKALGQSYTEFDQELVRDLDPNNTAVTIDQPEFQTMDFNFQSVDVGDSFTEKNFIQKAISAIKRNPLNVSLVSLVGFISLVLAYLDMGFFRLVQKAFAKDMDRIRKTGEDTIRQMRELLEALYTHLNRGPFRSMFTPDDSQSATTEEFVRGRFTQVMTKLSEDKRFETVEQGLLIGSISRLSNGKIAKTHSWKKEFKEFLRGMTRIESPAIRAFRRLVNAVDTYTNTPEIFEQNVMRVGEGNHAINPSEMIMAIYNQGKAATSEQMATRFRQEMAILIKHHPIKTTEKESRSSADRTKALQQKIYILLTRQDVGEEAWIMDALDIQDELNEVKKIPILIDGERHQRQTLVQGYTSLMQALNDKLAALLAQAKQGIHGIKDREVADKIDEAIDAYEPEFVRLEGEIRKTRYFLYPGAFASEANPFAVVKILEKRLQEIDTIEKELKKLKPDPSVLRNRKMTLIHSCTTVRNELNNAKAEFGGEVLEKIYNNRGLKLIAWSNDHLISGELFTQETARAFVDAFVALYQHFYRDAPNFVEIQAGETLDDANISLAFNHFTKEVRENLDTFNFDEGMSRQFDHAWHIGTRLHEAYNLLTLPSQISIPPKLPSLRLITRK